MSNLVWALSDRYCIYNKFYRMKWDKIMTTKLASMIFSVIIYIFGLLKKNLIITIVGAIALIITILIIIYLKDKEYIKAYKKRNKKYSKKLNGFKNIMKIEFKIDSKEKIEFILKVCNEMIIQTEYKQKVGKIIKNIMLAIITTSVPFNFHDIEKGIIFIYGFGIISFLITLYFVETFIVKEFMNTDVNKIKQLKAILTDIYITYYL